MKRWVVLIILCISFSVHSGQDYLFSTGFEPHYSVGGEVTGLTLLGEAMTISLNGIPQQTLNNDGAFTLIDTVEAGQTYLVSIDNANCTATNASGLMPYTNITNVTINCPFSFSSVYDIKQGLATGDVALQNMLVTACGSVGYYLETTASDPQFIGTDYSGIFVYDPTVDCLALQPGDRVDINPATVNEFFGEIQLHNATYAIQSSNNRMPSPVITTPAALNTVNAHPLNGVLVEVQSVTVTTANNGSDEYEVDSALLVSDRFHETNPYPEFNESFDFIRGPMAFNFNRNKIQPRTISDLGRHSKLIINEVDYDQPGSDTDEFIEIYNAGTGTADLTNISVELVNGSNSNSYHSISLSPLGTLGAHQYLIIGSSSVISALPPGTPNIELTTLLHNGAPDGIALVNTSAETVLDALSYEGSITSANIGFTNPVNLVEGTALSVADSNAENGSLSRIPNGVDTDDADSDWQFSPTPTPGEVNLGDNSQIYLVINEIDYDQPGSDSAEFLELYNPDSTTVDLSYVDVVLVNGSNNLEYARIPLTGQLNPGEFVVIANSGVTVPPGTLTFTIAENGLQNGAPDGIALINNTNNSLIDSLTYEGSITQASITGFPNPVNLVEGNPTSAVDSGTGSIIRMPDGSDTDDNATDFIDSQNPTPGTTNQF